MNDKECICWLQGFFEMNDEFESFSEKQVDTIIENISLALQKNKETGMIEDFESFRVLSLIEGLLLFYDEHSEEIRESVFNTIKNEVSNIIVENENTPYIGEHFHHLNNEEDEDEDEELSFFGQMSDNEEKENKVKKQLEEDLIDYIDSIENKINKKISNDISSFEVSLRHTNRAIQKLSDKIEDINFKKETDAILSSIKNVDVIMYKNAVAKSSSIRYNLEDIDKYIDDYYNNTGKYPRYSETSMYREYDAYLRLMFGFNLETYIKAYMYWNICNNEKKNKDEKQEIKECVKFPSVEDSRNNNVEDKNINTKNVFEKINAYIMNNESENFLFFDESSKQEEMLNLEKEKL